MIEFEIDWDRERRTGIAEAVLCEPKSIAQIVSILQAAMALPSPRLLLTRLASERFEALPHAVRRSLDYDPISRTAFLGDAPTACPGRVAVVCGGTSDLPVAMEALRTLAFTGWHATLVADVGVAGLWRLMSRLEEIRAHDAVIAVAGMEGALFSVLGGLVEAPIVAVPTSVGYGVGSGGAAALNGALASCAPGLAVVNIDNGFGAACIVIRILRRCRAGLRVAAYTPGVQA